MGRSAFVRCGVGAEGRPTILWAGGCPLNLFLPLVLLVLQLTLPSVLLGAEARGAHVQRRTAVRAAFAHSTRSLRKRPPSTWQPRYPYPLLPPAGSPQPAPPVFTSTALGNPSFATTPACFPLLPQERAPPTLD